MKGRRAASHRHDRFGDLGWWRVVQEVPGGTTFEESRDALRGEIVGHHDHAGPRRDESVEAVLHRGIAELPCDENHGRFLVGADSDEVAGGCDLAHHVDALLGTDESQQIAGEGVRVRDQDARRGGHRRSA